MRVGQFSHSYTIREGFGRFFQKWNRQTGQWIEARTPNEGFWLSHPKEFRATFKSPEFQTGQWKVSFPVYYREEDVVPAKDPLHKKWEKDGWVCVRRFKIPSLTEIEKLATVKKGWPILRDCNLKKLGIPV